MNWRKGLLRLWVVATALWVVFVATFDWALSGNRGGISAVGLSAESFYYHIIRPDLVASKRQFLDPKSPHHCVLPEQRERQKARLAELEAAEQKAEAVKQAAEAEAVRTSKPHQLSNEEYDALIRGPSAGEVDLIRAEMQVPECSADAARAISELEAVVDWGDFPDWARDAFLSLAYWMVGPPIVVFILGASLLWAFRGFRAG
jgi:hypothetical protein